MVAIVYLCSYNNRVRVTYDPDKRSRTLVHRGLEFEDAVSVFLGTTVEIEDSRRNYGERRIIVMDCWPHVWWLSATPRAAMIATYSA